MPKGTFNSIWLTGKGKGLYPSLVENMLRHSSIIQAADFEHVLWTNLDELKEGAADGLRDAGVVIKDHKECEKSSLYRYFKYFLEKGIDGDVAAFALASDILRNAIMQLSEPGQYYVYYDANDTVFKDLEASLKDIDKLKNDWDHFFCVKCSAVYIDIRNDVIITRKSNSEYIEMYLRAYEKNLKETYASYTKPTSDKDAVAAARKISAPAFWVLEETDPSKADCVEDGPPVLRMTTTFGYSRLVPVRNIDCNKVLPYEQDTRNMLTWLPGRGNGYSDFSDSFFSSVKKEQTSTDVVITSIFNGY